MPLNIAENSTVAVVGDVITDHHLYEGDRKLPTMLDRRGVKVVHQVGGAVGLALLIKAVLKQEREHADERGRNEKDAADAEERALGLEESRPVTRSNPMTRLRYLAPPCKRWRRHK